MPTNLTSLFRDNETWTPRAQEIEREFRQNHLNQLIDRCVEEGLSLRDVATILYASIDIEITYQLIKRNIKNGKH